MAKKVPLDGPVSYRTGCGSCADPEGVRRGAIMRMGDADVAQEIAVHLDGLVLAGPGAGHRRPAARPRGRDLRAGVVRARPRWRCT